jgi:2-polyprenyl-6-methoxyphenol hydroxylase-like FAD-dependent oxidoreductase
MRQEHLKGLSLAISRFSCRQSEVLVSEQETVSSGSARSGQYFQQDCCIVGGGPAGMVLALLLVRQGVRVTVLEAHEGFDRKFRGDTIHPSVLEIFEQIGLSDALLQLQHSKIYGPTLRASNTSFSPFDFRRLKTNFPFIMLVPQSKFLDFLAGEARRYPEFDLQFSSRVESLMEANGAICGVRYTSRDGLQEIRAPLVIGADGRFSTVRERARLVPIKTSPPMDILWFELPHLPGDVTSCRVLGGFKMGRVLAVFDRFDHWQVGYVFPKGTYQQVRAEGLESLRKSIAAIEPRFMQHVRALTDWHQFSLLSVESSRCPKWYLPGLLLIGDAAHAMSPIGGVGINYAIQDAVAAANLLGEHLKTQSTSLEDLAKVQRRRELPTRLIQRFQTVVQKRVLAPALTSGAPTSIPWFVRLFFATPIFRDLLAKLLAFGFRRERVRNLGRPPSAMAASGMA